MHTIEFCTTKDKETVGTWRFKADEASAPVQYVYVDKRAFAQGDVPEKLVVTMTELEASTTSEMP